MTERDPSRSNDDDEAQQDTPYEDDESVRIAEKEGEEATESTSQ